MRYWQIERLTGGLWLATDFRESGATEADALASAKEIAMRAGWDDVRLGREVGASDHYCAFAWVNAS